MWSNVFEKSLVLYCLETDNYSKLSNLHTWHFLTISFANNIVLWLFFPKPNSRNCKKKQTQKHGRSSSSKVVDVVSHIFTIIKKKGLSWSLKKTWINFITAFLINTYFDNIIWTNIDMDLENYILSIIMFLLVS